jgi:5-methyltetrahydrofolate--homocysteine methyltransferase
MSPLLTALHSGRVLLMDGAMGTELRRTGLADTEAGEIWNITHPDRVQAIHQAYRAAGANCLLTNTFQANRLTLDKSLWRDRLVEIIRSAVMMARSVAGTDGFVLGDLGPLPSLAGAEKFGILADLAETIPAFAGVDGLLLETYSDLSALLAARYCKEAAPDVPVLLSLTFWRNAAGELCSRSGHVPEAIAEAASGLGIAGLGANCGNDIGMEEIIEIIRRYRRVMDLPLFARPNAGTPTKVGDRWTYPHAPAQMAVKLPALLEAGVVMVGGCCGTTPEHIAAFRNVVDVWNARHHKGLMPPARHCASAPASEQRAS